MSRQARTICPCSGWSRDVGSSIHQPPLMLPQWHGFLVRVCSLSLRFWQEPIPQGSGLQLCMAQSTWRQTPWGIAIPEVLQYLHTTPPAAVQRQQIDSSTLLIYLIFILNSSFILIPSMYVLSAVLLFLFHLIYIYICLLLSFDSSYVIYHLITYCII